MKITGIKIQNIGIIEDTTIPFDHPLMLFFGEIRQGKSTILNCVRWCFGGPFPSDIIRHGADEALIETSLDCGIIHREFYRAKNGETKARDLLFIKDGRPQPRAFNEIARLINPFLADQDYLRKMGESDRKKYFAEMFAVDTSALDSEALEKASQARALRTKIDSYGHIDLTPVAPSNAEALRKEIAEVKAKHADQVAKWSAQLKEIRLKHGAEVQRVGQLNVDASTRKYERTNMEKSLGEETLAIERLEVELAQARQEKAITEKWLAENPPIEFLPSPEAPDTSELEEKVMSVAVTSAQEEQLEQAARNEEKAAQLARNQERANQRDADEAQLRTLEQRQREIKNAKIAKLKEVSDKCGIAGLEFDEAGNFTYQGTQAGMLSTSQIMKLSSELSALYPEGLGIELIDRAESLGKSIFGFIDRAKAESKTILATIVGEAPTEIPEEVGVFVVDAGKVTAAPKKKKAAQPKEKGLL